MNSDSETALSPKTGSKPSRVHRAPNLAQPAHTGAHKRAQARTSALRRAQARSGAHKRAQARTSAIRRMRACRVAGCCGRVVVVALGRVVGVGRRVAGPGTVSQEPCRNRCAWSGCIATQPSLASCSLVTIHQSVLRYSPQPNLAASVTIHKLYRETLLSPASVTIQFVY